MNKSICASCNKRETEILWEADDISWQMQKAHLRPWHQLTFINIGLVSGGDSSTFNLHLVSKCLSSTHSEIRWDLSLASAEKTTWFVILYFKEVKEHYCCLQYREYTCGTLCSTCVMVVCRSEHHNIFHLASVWHQRPPSEEIWGLYYRINLQHMSDAFLFMSSYRQCVILHFNPDTRLLLCAGQDKKQLCKVLLLLLLASALMAGPVWLWKLCAFY